MSFGVAPIVPEDQAAGANESPADARPIKIMLARFNRLADVSESDGDPSFADLRNDEARCFAGAQRERASRRQSPIL
jgi:hypothetical protein